MKTRLIEGDYGWSFAKGHKDGYVMGLFKGGRMVAYITWADGIIAVAPVKGIAMTENLLRWILDKNLLNPYRFRACRRYAQNRLKRDREKMHVL